MVIGKVVAGISNIVKKGAKKKFVRPKPKSRIYRKRRGTGVRGGSTPNDKLIDKKITKEPDNLKQNIVRGYGKGSRSTILRKPTVQSTDLKKTRVKPVTKHVTTNTLKFQSLNGPTWSKPNSKPNTIYAKDVKKQKAKINLSELKVKDNKPDYFD